MPYRATLTWLYLALRSERQGAPVLIWPEARPTARSAMKESSVSPELCGGGRKRHVRQHTCSAGALRVLNPIPALEPSRPSLPVAQTRTFQLTGGWS